MLYLLVVIMFLLLWVLFFQVRHVILLMCQYVNHLEVVRLPVYRPTEKECAEPKLYANNVRTLMAAEVRRPNLDRFYELYT